MSKLKFKIVTPENTILDQEVDMVMVPTTSGEMGILPGHVSLIAKIVPGELKFKIGNAVHLLAIGEGLIKIDNNTAVLLTDLAVEEKDIDAKEVEDAKKRAEEALSQKLSDEEYAETMAILEKSLAQLKIKRKHHTRY